MAIKGSATALDMQKQLYYIQELSHTLQTWERALVALPWQPATRVFLAESFGEVECSASFVSVFDGQSS